MSQNLPFCEIKIFFFNFLKIPIFATQILRKMGTIFNLFMVLIIIASVLLVIIIMAQNPKGGGLSGTFGGSSAQFGVQRTNDFMEKATWTLAIIIVSLIFMSVVLTAKPSTINDTKEGPKKENAAPQAPVQKPAATPNTKK